MQHWIQSAMENFGSLGVGLLMFIENVFPPIPSEVVMPWAGYAASQGTISLLGAITAGSIGSFLGTTAWYELARRIGDERMRRWIDRNDWWTTFSIDDLKKTQRWFDRWGGWSVLLCRMVPGIRTMISVPAGMTKMSFSKFAIFTAIGTVLWTGLLAGLGWWLGDNYASLATPLSYVSTIVVSGLFLWWIYRVATQSLHRSQAG